MQGGTTFHFVTEGVEVALQRAQAAAGGLDVRIGGGPATIRQFLRAGLIDELHLAIAPVLLGAGERVFNDGDAAQAGYACTRHVTTPQVMHVVLTRRGATP
jgi:dihydrofolate reductase